MLVDFADSQILVTFIDHFITHFVIPNLVLIQSVRQFGFWIFNISQNLFEYSPVMMSTQTEWTASLFSSHGAVKWMGLILVLISACVVFKYHKELFQSDEITLCPTSGYLKDPSEYEYNEESLNRPRWTCRCGELKEFQSKCNEKSSGRAMKKQLMLGEIRFQLEPQFN
jgi:hypothetical protein